jgi:hypothetical protein
MPSVIAYRNRAVITSSVEYLPTRQINTAHASSAVSDRRHRAIDRSKQAVAPWQFELEEAGVR